ncbi:hypothetical protein BDD21_1734 [Thiocapsa rosea]|uniref:Uncharacterized protein n=1 Tax=Thiocapsa rosea TaxID=69360 RepID=A0A495V756_9GAMM|nr:hypothetical protein BDD21_1734 [Thiocapsa rosea]
MEDGTVLCDGAFETERLLLPDDVREELLAHAKLLQRCGPSPRRPAVETRKGSRYAKFRASARCATLDPWRDASMLPTVCPFSEAELLDDDYWPE